MSNDLLHKVQALLRDIRAYDHRMDDQANDGADARPPEGDDYNTLSEMIFARLGPFESKAEDLDRMTDPQWIASNGCCPACGDTGNQEQAGDLDIDAGLWPHR